MLSVATRFIRTPRSRFRRLIVNSKRGSARKRSSKRKSTKRKKSRKSARLRASCALGDFSAVLSMTLNESCHGILILRISSGNLLTFSRSASRYGSDFTDALSIQCLAAFTFLYFACLTPLITFGGLLGDATENRLGTMESLCSGFLCGIVYGLFSGQPLTILGSTGPVLVFENILYDFCK